MSTKKVDSSPQEDLQSRILEAELSLKKVELELKQRELNGRSGLLSKIKISAVEATVAVGVLAFCGSLIGTYLQESNKLALKEREQESALILDAMKGDNPETNLNRLRLLIDAGFIRDEGGLIHTLILSGKYGDQLIAPSSPTLLEAIVDGTAPTLMKEIAQIIGALPEVELKKKPDFAGIAAVVKQAGRVVLIYDSEKLESFNPEETNNWTVPAILAHELGHVVLGHMDDTLRCFTSDSDSNGCVTYQKMELDADRYAGFVLRRLGASLEQTKQALAFLPQTDSITHPGRKKGIQAIAEGWKAK